MAKAQWCQPLVTQGNKALFYGFDMSSMLKGLLAELMSGNMGAVIPTYVRSDNSDAANHVGSVNTVTNVND